MEIDKLRKIIESKTEENSRFYARSNDILALANACFMDGQEDDETMQMRFLSFSLGVWFMANPSSFMKDIKDLGMSEDTLETFKSLIGKVADA